MPGYGIAKVENVFDRACNLCCLLLVCAPTLYEYVEDQLLDRVVAEDEENNAMTRLEGSIERLIVAIEGPATTTSTANNAAA